MKNVSAMVVLGLLAAPAPANEVASFVDDQHVKTWNRFSEQVFALHERLTSGRAIRQEVLDGEYGGEAAKGWRYHEIEYYDSASGLLLSRVRWDGRATRTWHVAEAYVHDREGRVARDYVTLYLPWARNAPIRTYISLHRHAGELHAFRQFDASGELLYEQCHGRHAGKDVDLSLEPYRITASLVQTPVYRACFDGLPVEAGPYLTPH